jgi:hypothetical protein
MGHRTSLSGHIQEPWYLRDNDRQMRRLWESNRHVIHSLPDGNDGWPPLYRRMFSFSQAGSKFVGPIITSYRGSVIYFGGSFSSIFNEWEQWLDKFEGLLRRLYWEHAVVIGYRMVRPARLSLGRGYSKQKFLS